MIADAEHYRAVASKIMRRDRPFDDPQTRKVLGSVDINKLIVPSSRVLDIGCGEGVLVSQISLRTGAYCVGVDLKNFPGRRASFEFVEANMESLPFQDESFDFVYSIWSYYYALDKLKALGEVHRVLDVGGLALLQMDDISPSMGEIISTFGLGEELEVISSPRNIVRMTKKRDDRLNLPSLRESIIYGNYGVTSCY